MQRDMYRGATARIALIREQSVDKLCFGRMDFSESREKSEIDIDYGIFGLTRTSLSLNEVKFLVKGLVGDNGRLQKVTAW